jgi:hypothetical protein
MSLATFSALTAAGLTGAEIPAEFNYNGLTFEAICSSLVKK